MFQRKRRPKLVQNPSAESSMRNSPTTQPGATDFECV
jgi:hypothetical protein